MMCLRLLAIVGVTAIWCYTAVLNSQTVAPQPSPTLQPRGDIKLRLRCISKDELRIAIENIGANDLFLTLGRVVNGYFVSALDLVVNHVERYIPRRYGGGHSGVSKPWLQLLPAQSTLTLSSIADDYVGTDSRLTYFPAGVKLAVRLTIKTLAQDREPGRYWTGTLTSNTCVVPKE